MKIFLNFLQTWNVQTDFRAVSAIIILALLTSCSGNHLINNSQYLAGIEKAFTLKKEFAAKRNKELFTVFNNHLSTEQSEALKFLYSYMPLSDLADYNGDFFLANVNISLKAKKETSWGKDIPDAVFLHYVLPVRINNENLDSFRISYYDELISKVKGKSLADAALEVNHWCHEKVNYQPSDIRTSAPMSTILSSRGRCGEESTFTVAALRTIGIPARQVYTPRWAHTDDNHAWVEIWNKGEWFYMGACEPEPVLDRGWFTEPARRAMLVHTKSFGAFQKDENAITKNPDFTDVNNLAKYAVTKTIFVKVLGSDNLPVKNVSVEFQLYNYAEFYPLAVVPSNENGISRFETGLGDLLIWAHKDENFAFKKISVGETDTLELKLNSQSENFTKVDLDLDVPIIRTPLPVPSKELSEQNAQKINTENGIRQKYIDSWMKPSAAKALALKLKIDTAKVMSAIERSMGNFKEISSFLSETPDSLKKYALTMLEILPDKDLRDIKKSVLSDHLLNISNINLQVDKDSLLFLENILNPRIANEMLIPWRHYFKTKLPSGILSGASSDPSLIVQYLNENIKIADEENYYNTPITPVGVHELKVSDSGSRAICFVAMCRSLGIPSRLEPGTNVPQYYFGNKWNDVYFSGQKQPDPHKGYIKLQSSDTKPVPEYYLHFTLARFEGGRYNTLEYDYNKKISEFKDELPLPPGRYMLVTGNRINNGKILSEISFFNLAENEHKTIDVKIRKDVSEKKILGKIDLAKISSFYKSNGTSQLCSNDKGIVVFWIDPDMEPAKHIFHDLPFLKSELDAWGGIFLFLSDTGNGQDQTIKLQSVRGLPANTSFGSDEKLAIFKDCIKLYNSPDITLPVVIVSDRDGNISFISSGYRIGIGEQILKYLQ